MFWIERGCDLNEIPCKPGEYAIHMFLGGELVTEGRLMMLDG
jgi:hypothetical protein